MIFRVLGPLEVHEPTGDRMELGAHKPAALLATLLLQANAWVSAERLIAAIWPERDAPASADRNLKTYVWRVRKMLPGRVESKPGAYRITVAQGELDTDVVAALATRGDQELAAGDASAAVATFRRAAAIWRGTPFEEVGNGEADAAVARLTELRRHVQESLAGALLADGSRGEAITVLRALTTADPLRERTWAALVLALHADGRRAEALACYQQARATLVDELGVEPGVELAGAQQQVLAGDTGAPDEPAVIPAVAEAAPDTLPRDLADFTGRAGELAAVLTATGPAGCGTATPVVLICGMGGVGKSALAVHAAHHLAQRYPDGRLHLNLRDGGEPIGAAEALRRLLVAVGAPVPEQTADREARWRASVAGRRLLLVLDDAQDAAEVLPLLPGGSDCCVLVTARSGLPGLDGAFVVGLDVPTDDEAETLFRCIAGPARVSGEPAAVAAVVRACGNLPLAIRIAAARLAQRPLWTVSALAARLRDPQQRRRELNRPGQSVLAVFEPAYRGLSRPHRRLFDLLACASGRIDVPAAAACAHVPRADAEHMLERLADEHLLTESAPGHYRLHPLVRDLALTGTSSSTVDTNGREGGTAERGSAVVALRGAS